MTQKRIDVRLRSTGSLVIIDPISSRAVSWIDENIGADNGFQPYYPSVLCEARYADAIIDGMREEGLRVA